MSNIAVGFAIIYKWNKSHINGKLLGSPRVQLHGATSSRIHSGFHHEYNYFDPLWMWKEGASFHHIMRVGIINPY